MTQSSPSSTAVVAMFFWICMPFITQSTRKSLRVENLLMVAGATPIMENTVVVVVLK
jgi:hypothetical protein